MASLFAPGGLARRGARKLLSPLRDERLRRAVSRLQRDLTPLDAAALRAALESLIGEPPRVMVMHSSLSACGRFVGGPDAVLDVLADYTVALALVTHSYCYPEQPEEPGPVFDPVSTPSQNGLLTNVFRQRRGVMRSIHATHSLAAAGPHVEALIAGHYVCDSPTGEGTPYSRLVQCRSAALMFGVSFHYYTFFHTAEFESGSEYAFQAGARDRLRVVDDTGRVRECLSRRQNWAPNRFAEAGDLLERKGLAHRVRLGRGVLRFVPDASKAHDFLIERLRRTPDFLRQSCAVELH